MQLLEGDLTAPERSSDRIAQMLSMIRVVVPAVSLSVNPVGPDGLHSGPGVIFRAARLRLSPEEARREYLLRYAQYDPYHARHVAGGARVIGGTFEDPDFLTNRANPLLEYASELGLPHFLRIYLRMDLQLTGYVFIARSHHHRPFSERELSFLRLAHPLLESVYASAARPGPSVSHEELLVEAGLTPRETDVARHAATGMRAREIAEVLVLTEATVKTHLARVYRKLGVRGKAELAARLGSLET